MTQLKDRILIAIVAIVAGAVTLAAQQRDLPFFAALDTSRPILYVIGDGSRIAGFQEGDETLAHWRWRRGSGRAMADLHSKPRSRGRLLSASSGSHRPAACTVKCGRSSWTAAAAPSSSLCRTCTRSARRSSLAPRATRCFATIVYLTCLHELGHGFGLEHTADFGDIMYFFGHGGDIPSYFQRYRERLTDRENIQRVSGLSDDDVRRLRALYPATSSPR